MLSIVIVNWNTRDLLSNCLKSIFKYPPTQPWEVIVVDNASSDSSVEMVRADFPAAKVIASEVNLGYAGGNNAGFAASQGDLILALNPDTEVLESTFAALNQIACNHSEVGAIAARLENRDGSAQRSVRAFPTWWNIFGDLTFLDRIVPGLFGGGYRQHTFNYSEEQIAEQPMGTFLAFRRDALAAVGVAAQPFDESFPIFFNEVDLLFRMRTAGYECLYAPLVKVFHVGGAGTRQVRPAMIWESHRSLLRYMKKHRAGLIDRILLTIFTPFVLLGAWIRAKGHYAEFRP